SLSPSLSLLSFSLSNPHSQQAHTRCYQPTVRPPHSSSTSTKNTQKSTDAHSHSSDCRAAPRSASSHVRVPRQQLSRQLCPSARQRRSRWTQLVCGKFIKKGD